MKQNGMYRYCIQFRAHTESEIRAGEMLEKLGRKKSAVIITALNEYLDHHPELSDGSHTQINISSLSLPELELRIRTIIDERLANNHSVSMQALSQNQIPNSEDISQEIIDMIGDLELFG